MATGEVRQKPIELILARNFIASISTPSFLVEHDGRLVYFNDTAGALLGQRFEETGALPASVWGARWGPFAADGSPIPYHELPTTTALRQGRPAVGRFTMRDGHGEDHEILVTSLPIVGTDAFRGAIVFFWVEDEAPSADRGAP